MSKDMKLIMENWRKLVKETKEQVIEGPLAAAATLGLAGFGAEPQIEAPDVTQAIELAQAFSDYMEKKGKSESAKLADQAVSKLKSYNNAELDTDADGYVDWGNRDITSNVGQFAEEFLTISLDDDKAEKLMNVWTSEAEAQPSTKIPRSISKDPFGPMGGPLGPDEK